jgi:hypothetical protein
MGGFSGSQGPVRIFYIEINGNFIFDLLIFTEQFSWNELRP